MLSFFTFALFQPLVGKLNDRLGARVVMTGSMFLLGSSLLLSSLAQRPWQLSLVYGIAAAIALAGGSNVTATSVIAHWFVDKRGFAMGLALSGMAVGQLALVPLSLYLISNYSWRISLVVAGTAVLVLFMPLAYLLVRSRPENIGLKAYGYKEYLDRDKSEAANNSSGESAREGNTGRTKAGIKAGSREGLRGTSARMPMFAVLKDRRFWLLALPYFICGFTDVGLIGTHFIPFNQGRGFALASIALAISTSGIFNIVGTIGTGYLSDRFFRSRLLAMIYIIRALTFALLLTARSPWMLIVFAVFYGLTEMASIAPTSSLCTDMFKKHPLGTVFGLVSVSHQLGGAAGTFIPGVLYDLTGSYFLIIGLGIALLLGSSVVVARVRV